MPKLTIYTLFSLLSISLLMSTSCGPKKVTPQSKLEDTVMAIHDEVMPKMKEIYRLKKGLKKKAKSTTDNAPIDQVIASLDRADDAMMDWMAGYDAPSEGAPDAMEYLEKEKIKIETVRKEMLSAIQHAQKILDAQ